MSLYMYYQDRIRGCKLNDSEAINAILEMAELDHNVDLDLYGRILSVAHEMGFAATEL
jgi:hypothetical protein